MADPNDELRRVLVLSSARFHDLAGRAIIAPAAAARPYPWGIVDNDEVFAIALLQSISVDRLLERVGHVPAAIVRTARQAMRLLI